MSLFLGKNNNNEILFHATSTQNDSQDSIQSILPNENTVYHSHGYFLEVHRHNATIHSSNSTHTVVEFSINAMYDLWRVADDGTYRKKAFIIVSNGRAQPFGVNHGWYSSPSSMYYFTSGYNYNYRFTWVPGSSAEVYMLIFSAYIDGTKMDTPIKATSISIDTPYGIYFGGGRESLFQSSYISNVINTYDPTFTDHSGKNLQIINSFNYSGGSYPVINSINLTSGSSGHSMLEYNGRAIIASNGNMWRIPLGESYTTYIPISDRCFWWGNHWLCEPAVFAWAFNSWINESFNITTVPSGFNHFLVSLTYYNCLYRTGTEWRFTDGEQNYTWLVTRGGPGQQIFSASLDNIHGPDSAMKIYLELSSSGVLRWYHSAYGSNVGGFSVCLYGQRSGTDRAKFVINPVG